MMKGIYFVVTMIFSDYLESGRVQNE